MRSIGLISKVAIVGALVAGTAFIGVTASMGSSAAARPPAPCARVRVVAAPQLNTQAGSVETIRNVITSCASKSEVVQIKQRLSLPGAFSGSFQLPPRQTVEITQQIPYVCCGTYFATDRMYSTIGRLLHTARTSWIFA
jgi:hypothetical protein